jgi:hypothetical protein
MKSGTVPLRMFRGCRKVRPRSAACYSSFVITPALFLAECIMLYGLGRRDSLRFREEIFLENTAQDESVAGNLGVGRRRFRQIHRYRQGCRYY